MKVEDLIVGNSYYHTIDGDMDNAKVVRYLGHFLPGVYRFKTKDLVETPLTKAQIESTNFGIAVAYDNNFETAIEEFCKNARKGVSETLLSRSNTHGNFGSNGKTMQSLKDICREGDTWPELKPHQKEAIDMICHKIGRIVNGDGQFKDHWHDIVGYATLVEEEL